MINPMLEAELLAHLDNQIRSAQRLLRLVLDQGEAIRARDTERVLAKLAEIQTEMGRRGRLEQERTSAAPERRRAARRARAAGHARAPLRADHARPAPAPRASARPSCAACSPRSPASTASTARSCARSSPSSRTSCGSSATSPRPATSRRGAPPGAARRRRRRCTGPSTSRPSHADLLLLRPPDVAARAARPAARARHDRPQHRQRLDGRATRARRPCSPPRRRSSSRQGAVQGGAGAHIGSGVDVQAYRRIRDTFLDLQYRAQATRLGEEAGERRGPGPRRAGARRARPTTASTSSCRSSGARGATSPTRPTTPAARQALIEQADALADAFGTVDAQLELVGQQAAERVRRADRARAARSSRSAARSPRSTTRSSASSPPATRRTT